MQITICKNCNFLLVFVALKLEMKTKKELKKEYKIKISEAKKRYLNECDMAENEYHKGLHEFYLKIGKNAPKDPPKRSVLEEVGNAVTHGLGAMFAIVAFVFMLLSSDSAEEYGSAVIYFLGLFLMFLMSCLYHAFSHGSAVKRLFRRFDYSGIYLLIGATFAPVLICYFNNLFGLMFFAVQWCVIVAGITFVAIFGPTRLKFLHIPLYLVLGWSALFLLPFMVFSGAAGLATWILLGGIIYTVGIIPFAIKMNASHFIWHFFVLAGAVVQWVGIFKYIYLA